MNYFTEEELSCKCGCGISNFSDRTLDKLNQARHIAETPFVVSSACRCESHNANVGGERFSSHIASEKVSCCAMDIVVTTSKERFAIISSLTKVGFNRIGIRKDFIHVDDDIDKISNVTWVY
jgi:hypothetical protein